MTTMTKRNGAGTSAAPADTAAGLPEPSDAEAVTAIDARLVAMRAELGATQAQMVEAQADLDRAVAEEIAAFRGPDLAARERARAATEAAERRLRALKRSRKLLAQAVAALEAEYEAALRVAAAAVAPLWAEREAALLAEVRDATASLAQAKAQLGAFQQLRLALFMPTRRDQPERVTVEILGDLAGYNRGERCGLAPAVAARLVKRGVVRYVDPWRSIADEAEDGR